MKKEIIDFYKKSEQLRNGYIVSLSKTNDEELRKFRKIFPNVSEMFFEMYSFANGTKADIKDQKFFDFIPGFRLMPIEELMGNYEKHTIEDNKVDSILIPFLNDYAGCYYAYSKKDDVEVIVYISEEGIEIVHNSVMNFWITINAFYDENVYFLDDDGYLSYDFEREGIIGRKLNPSVCYWN